LEFDRAARMEKIKSIIEGEDLQLLTPSNIQIPLSFNEGKIAFFTQSDLEDTEKLISKFIDDFVKPRTERVFMWEEDNVINFGTIILVENIPEMHYISIEIGK
jgi:hypothetical protein